MQQSSTASGLFDWLKKGLQKANHVDRSKSSIEQQKETKAILNLMIARSFRSQSNRLVPKMARVA